MLDIPASERIIVALDCDHGRAVELAGLLKGRATWLKVGMTLYYASGPAIVEYLKDLGFKVFLDLKLHDIPHPVGGAVGAACAAGPALLNAHASGGEAMMKAAANAASGTGVRMLAVTVLTSLGAPDLERMGWSLGPAGSVLRLAALAAGSGMDGVVCSPAEASAVRSATGPGFLIVTPGIRPAGSDTGDQARVATPGAAVRAGADALVVGRPVSGAPDPRAAAAAILEEIEAAEAPGARVF